MCLDVVYRGKQKKEALAKLPDEFPVAKKKKHVVTIGEQSGRVVVVLSHITFPKKCGKKP